MTPTLWSVFDVDRTITRRPTYSLFLLFAARRLAPWRILLLPAIVPAAIAYACGLMPRRAMKETMHRIAIGRAVPRAAIEPVAEAFAERLLRDGLYLEAVERMAGERGQGRELALATAAPDLYIAPLARRLGIAHVAATGGDWRDDRLGYRIAGENCYGDEKLSRITALIAGQGMRRDDAHIRFFTDHASDRPVCDWADESFAVNPSKKMLALARLRGWPVLDWRRS